MNIELTVLDQLFHGPEGKLGVIRRQANPSPQGTPIGQVASDLADAKPAKPRPERLRGVPQSIADREPEQHAAYTVARDWALLSWRWRLEQGRRRDRKPAFSDEPLEEVAAAALLLVSDAPCGRSLPDFCAFDSDVAHALLLRSST